MACNFTAHRIAGQNKVTLVHPITVATDPGFGLLQGSSRVELVPSTGAAIPLAVDVWSPSAIVATLPDGTSNGGKLRVVIVTGTATTCTHDAEFGGLLGTGLSSQLFTVPVPELAHAGDKVTLVNLLPGFSWQRSEHAPVRVADLLAREFEIPDAQIVGWGGNRLQVTLPSETTLMMEQVIQPFLFKFGTDTHSVPIQINKLPALDPGLGTVVTPALARAGGQIELYNALPGFVFDRQKHGDLRIRNTLGGPWIPVTVADDAWGKSTLRATLPTREELGANLERIAFQLQFTRSVVPINLLMEFSLLWEIFLGTLTCKDTEDTTGRDEPYLRIGIDQLVPMDRPLQPLNEDESAAVNEWFPFLNSIRVSLYDDDTDIFDDDDDHLGTNVFGRSSDQNVMTFTLDGARYELDYVLREKPLPV